MHKAKNSRVAIVSTESIMAIPPSEFPVHGYLPSRSEARLPTLCLCRFTTTCIAPAPCCASPSSRRRGRNGITGRPHWDAREMDGAMSFASVLSLCPKSTRNVLPWFPPRCPSFQKFASTYSRKTMPMPFSTRNIVMALYLVTLQCSARHLVRSCLAK